MTVITIEGGDCLCGKDIEDKGLSFQVGKKVILACRLCESCAQKLAYSVLDVLERRNYEREIKFRVWDEKNEKMLTDGFDVAPDGNVWANQFSIQD